MQLKRNKQAIGMRSVIFLHMLETRNRKYRSFLRYLRIFKYVAFAPGRGEFLESYYTVMRYLDDVVDGDLSLPEGYSNEEAYISGKIAFFDDPVNPVDDLDNLIIYCLNLASGLKMDFHQESGDILNSLLFDAKRRGKKIIFPREELHRHFHLLDVRGTIRATLKIFRDDPEKYIFLEPLGLACRHQYNIEDFESDIAAGYVNIPGEDCALFGIEKEDLAGGSSDAIRSWLCHHAREGLKLLEEHHRLMPRGDFSLLEKTVFRVVYENPARKVFMKILAEK